MQAAFPVRELYNLFQCYFMLGIKMHVMLWVNALRDA